MTYSLAQRHPPHCRQCRTKASSNCARAVSKAGGIVNACTCSFGFLASSRIGPTRRFLHQAFDLFHRNCLSNPRYSRCVGCSGIERPRLLTESVRPTVAGQKRRIALMVNISSEKRGKVSSRTFWPIKDYFARHVSPRADAPCHHSPAPMVGRSIQLARSLRVGFRLNTAENAFQLFNTLRSH